METEEIEGQKPFRCVPNLLAFTKLLCFRTLLILQSKGNHQLLLLGGEANKVKKEQKKNHISVEENLKRILNWRENSIQLLLYGCLKKKYLYYLGKKTIFKKNSHQNFFSTNDYNVANN